MIWRAAIIGCGKIAGGYDDVSPVHHVLTHAKAYQQNPATQLVAVADVDGIRAQEFAKRWKVPLAFNDPAQMLAKVAPDIISICSPDSTHALWLESCLSHAPKVVWCEKPIVLDDVQGEQLVTEYEKRGILLAVNYLRRWDKTLFLIKKRIRDVDPTTIKAIIKYGKGLRHNGSHALDLLLDWFGAIAATCVFNKITDCYADDPTISGWIKFTNGAEAYLIACDERHYTLWEMDIVGPTWRCRLICSGRQLEIYQVRDDPVFASYKQLDPMPSIHQTELLHVMTGVLENIVEALAGRQELYSTGRSALATLKVCNQLLVTPMLLPNI